VKLEFLMSRNVVRTAAVAAAMCALLLAPGCAKKKYENPITKDTQQPDKVLFDRAVDDIEHARFEQARLTLQTLMNTYDTSEYLAKAKLAVADSWYREGGSHGLAQAEAEYKDFILFYPQLEEAAEAQEKVCKMPGARRMNAGSSWCSFRIANSLPMRSSICGRRRKFWRMRNIG